MNGTLWLDTYAKNEIAGELDIDRRGPLSRAELEKYLLEMLNKTLETVQTRSPFYQEKLLGLDLKGANRPADITAYKQLSSVDELSELPFTTVEELERDEYRICSVRPDSGVHLTTISEKSSFSSAVKKILFTQNDQERTVRFFYYFLRAVVKEDDRVLILLPARRPGTSGDLIRRAVEKTGALSVPYGPLNDEVLDWGIYLDLLELEKISCIIGPAAQVASLAQVAAGRAEDRRYSELIAGIKSRLKNVVLGGNISSERNLEEIRSAWNCGIYEFFGNTETDMACAAGCAGGSLHLRESDIYVEVVDPESGEPLPDGEFGEIVFTTLNRGGMPLVRCKTGKSGRRLGADCGCGSRLRRIELKRKR